MPEALDLIIDRNSIHKIDWCNNDDFINDRLIMPNSPHHLPVVIEEVDTLLLPLGHAVKLPHIDEAIKKAAYILSLEEGWDGENAIAIPEFIFDRAIDFVKRYSELICKNEAITIIAPHISPLNDGSIDLLWKTRKASLLVNIKNSEDNIAYYYGILNEDNSKSDFNGQIPTDSILPFFASWLQGLAMED